MDKSIFTDKTTMPTNSDLTIALSDTFVLWHTLVDYVHSKYPEAMDEWSYSGDKYGWSFRIKDKKRNIIYLLPRDRYFKVAFVFGQKSSEAVMDSGIAKEIKTELGSAKVYAEGRGIRIDINNTNIISNIKKLIDIKLSH
jgi:hypothetical protein